jgi:hypothetical protein
MSFWSAIQSGVRRFSAEVEEVFDDVGDLARQPMANTPKGNSDEVGGGEVKDGVEPEAASASSFATFGPFATLASFASDQVARIWEGGSSLAEGVVEGTAAVLNDVGEGLYHVGHGVVETVRGNVGDGLKEMGSGAVQATVGGVVDGVCLAGARAASAVQVIAHVEQRERRLSPSEVGELRATFGDSIDYGEVRIKEGRAGVFSVNDRAFTSGNTIYMKMDPTEHAWKTTLMHEMVHVWQYQNGGADYQSKSLAAQFITRDAYQWRSAAFDEKPWADLNPEDQGALIEEFYRQGYFTTGTFTVFDDTGAAVDRTAYANWVVDELRRKKGAP